MKHLALSLAFLALSLRADDAAQEWIPLFDGMTLNGWQPSENKGTWKVEEGTLVSRGPRSHLFYAGEVHNHDFKNFELRAEVKTTPGSNSGIYVHTHYQESGFPETGYECQVINSNPDVRPGQYVERKMTSSIYAIRNVWKAPVKDNEWFRYRIVVQGKTIRTYINDGLMAEYTESENACRAGDKKGRLLSSGTFALQGHDPDSVVFYRNILVKSLPDSLPTPGTPTDDPAFDYVIADPGAGTRVDDPQRFMDQLVGRVEQLAAAKRVNIYASPTAFPDSLKADYDALWTADRMDRVIKALKDGNVAMEINDRLKVPSATFIKRAKAAGVRFAFGSDNTGPNDLGKLSYCIAMIEECHLTANNLWMP